MFDTILAFLADNRHVFALFATAQLLFLIVRSQDIIIALKPKHARTQVEEHRMQHGLLRSLLLEMFVFTPASATLVLLTVAPFLPSELTQDHPVAVYAVLGCSSYGFPFAAVRALVTRIALKTLQEFAVIVEAEDTSKEKQK
jgi:hypothetical protein